MCFDQRSVISHTHLDDDTKVGEPASVLQAGEPLGGGGREAECPEGIVAVSHGMDIGYVQESQSSSRVVIYYLCALTLRGGVMLDTQFFNVHWYTLIEACSLTMIILPVAAEKLLASYMIMCASAGPV